MRMPGNNVRGVIARSSPTIAGVISDNRVIGLQLSRELLHSTKTTDLQNTQRSKIACRRIFNISVLIQLLD